MILASVKDGKAGINDKTKPLLEIIAKYTNLPVEQVVGNCAYIDPDGKLDVKNVANQIELAAGAGFCRQGIWRRCDHRQGICEGGLMARLIRHCGRREAIQLLRGIRIDVDCFVASLLAMTAGARCRNVN